MRVGVISFCAVLAAAGFTGPAIARNPKPVTSASAALSLWRAKRRRSLTLSIGRFIVAMAVMSRIGALGP